MSCALGLSVGLDATAARADISTLTITYTTPTSLQVTLSDGTVVKSGSVVPAGSYELHVLDNEVTGDQVPNLKISGPGVSFANSLNEGMGIPAEQTFGPYTLQTSSTYSIEDSNLGESSLLTFSTTATMTAGAAGAASTYGGTTTRSGGSTPTPTMLAGKVIELAPTAASS